MNKEELFESLKKLNKYEEIGKTYCETYGCPMDYIQLYYLMNHPDEPELIKSLASADEKPEQKEIRSRIRNESLTGLSESLFISGEKNVEIQQLLRYVNIPAHKHRFIELVCVLEGTCTHTIDNTDYVHTAGDFTIIPPDVRHVLVASPDCVCLTAKMRVSTFGKCFSDLLLGNSLLSVYFNEALSDPYYRCALTLHSGNDIIFRETILNMYLQQLDGKKLSDTIIEHLWIVLLSYLIQNYSDTIEFLTFYSVAHAKMIEILNFIYENHKEITLTETAEHFHYSVPYLSRFIKEQTGRNFSALLQNYRLEKACEMLKSTDLNVENICFETGYYNTSQFIRLFRKRYGITPYRYRKENNSQTVAE